MRKITTFTGLIADDESGRLSESSKVHFQKIQHSVKRMQNLLDDLLFYSHSTKTSLEFENVDLNTIIKTVTDDLAEEINENKAEIKTDSLPTVKGLPFQLKQLFENLVINSLKYRQDTLSPLICIEATMADKKEIQSEVYKKVNQYYKIIFKDNGLGFEQSYAEKIFQLFQRVHTGRKYAGTGIGLTICKKIVQNHHGFIKATSEINSGTTFEIYLPYK